MNMNFCKKHKENPVTGYNLCPSCEIEIEREKNKELSLRIQELEAQLAQNTSRIEDADAKTSKDGVSMSDNQLISKLTDVLHNIDDYDDLAKAATYLIGTNVKYIEDGEFLIETIEAGRDISEKSLLKKLVDILTNIDDYDELATTATYLIGAKVEHLCGYEFFVSSPN